MTKKTLRNFIKVSGFALLAVAILGLVGAILLTIFSLFRDEGMEPYWEIAKNAFAILGPIGTLGAVVVALNKEEINRILYSPEFKITLSSPSPIFEFDSNDNRKVAKCYQQVRIENIGRADALGCRVELINVKYDKNRKNKPKLINPTNPQPITCSTSSGTITKSSYWDMPLFHVDNPNAESNPSNQEDVLTAAIQFSGMTLPKKLSSMGKYQVEYRVSCESGMSKTFKVEVDWVGEWSDSQDEMAEKFLVKLN